MTIGENYSAGMYFVRITDAVEEKTVRIIKN
jgi:hypothetical protein